MDLLAFVKAQLPPAPARVLEVGCGDGELARALDRLGYGVTAIDPHAPEGAIFRSVSLEELDEPAGFDAAVASRALHHIVELAGAVAKLHDLLVPEGRLIVFEHAWERFDEPTARWYIEQHGGSHRRAATSIAECVTEWGADHTGLHDSAALRRELDRHFTERFFAWSPYLHGELAEGVEREERRLIDRGQIQATGFLYVGERRGG